MGAPGQRIIRTAVDWSSAGLVLADFLAGRFTYRSREEWCERIASGEITLNSSPVSPEYQLELHDIIEYRPQDIPEPPARTDYRIVYEDEDILVIDKPGNLCVHPSGPFYRNTLWFLLRQSYPQIHFVNRLDRETSGLLLAAKNSRTAAAIAAKGSVSGKSYLVMVHGRFSEPYKAEGFLVPAGTLVRKKRRFKEQCLPDEKGETSLTYLTPEAVGENFSLVRAVLGTGRTHQIRATLHSLGFPVVGDKLYGLDERLFIRQKREDFTEDELVLLQLPRQALHSTAFEFIHPASGDRMFFESPLPPELKEFADKNIIGV